MACTRTTTRRRPSASRSPRPMALPTASKSPTRYSNPRSISPLSKPRIACTRSRPFSSRHSETDAMRIVVALGGNALLKRGEPMTAQAQRANVKVAAQALAQIAEEHQLVISHGNGPQVGLLALQGAAYKPDEAYPLDVLGAETEGMIGYMIEQELGNLLPFEVPFATLLTMVEV